MCVCVCVCVCVHALLQGGNDIVSRDTRAKVCVDSAVNDVCV